MGRKRIEQIAIHAYIPEEINWEDIQKKFPLPKHIHVDGLNYILCWMVIWINFQHKKNYRKGVPINAVKLKRVLHEYHLFIKYLKDVGIIVLKKNHKAGRNSRMYDFTKKYRKSFIGVYIRNNRLIKKHNVLKSEEKAETTLRYPYLTRWFSDSLHLDIDSFFRENLSKGAQIPTLEETVGTIEEVGYLDAAIRLSNKQFSYSFDTTSGRFHSSITSLKKIFRQYLYFENVRLGQVDLRSSQIYFLAVFFCSVCDENYNELLVNSLQYSEASVIGKVRRCVAASYLTLCLKKEVIEFVELIEGGKPYEYFAERMLAKCIDHVERSKIDREFAKDALIQFLFARNNSKKANIVKVAPIFKEVFPSLYIFIYQLKALGHQVLSLLLQSLERYYLIDIVAKELSERYPEFCLYSLHDAFITTEPQLGVLNEFVTKRLYELTGVVATFEPKEWAPKPKVPI